MLTSVQNVCVVTTFYTLESMKSILLPKFIFFSFKATPFSQKYKFIILLVYLFFMGCCTSYYNIPPSLPEGGYRAFSALLLVSQLFYKCIGLYPYPYSNSPIRTSRPYRNCIFLLFNVIKADNQGKKIKIRPPIRDEFI